MPFKCALTVDFRSSFLQATVCIDFKNEWKREVKSHWKSFMRGEKSGGFRTLNFALLHLCFPQMSFLFGFFCTLGRVGSGSGRNLWVSGLSSSTRATDLKNLFSKYGKVCSGYVNQQTILSV